VLLRTRLRPGIYWDETGTERPCGILEIIDQHGEVRRVAVVNAATGEPIPDPVEAIPVGPEPG